MSERSLTPYVARITGLSPLVVLLVGAVAAGGDAHAQTAPLGSEKLPVAVVSDLKSLAAQQLSTAVAAAHQTTAITTLAREAIRQDIDSGTLGTQPISELTPNAVPPPATATSGASPPAAPLPAGPSAIEAKIATILTKQQDILNKRATDVVDRATPAERATFAKVLDSQVKNLGVTLHAGGPGLSQSTQDYIQTTIDTKKEAADAWRKTNAPLPRLSVATAQAVVNATSLSFLVCGGRVVDENRSTYWQKDTDSFVANHSQLFDSVGRLEVGQLVRGTGDTWLADGDPQPTATAFAVGPQLVMTNAHVLKDDEGGDPIAVKNASGEWELKDDKDLWITFGAEYPYKGCTPRIDAKYRIAKIVAVDEALDAAILYTVEKLPETIPIIDAEQAVVPDKNDFVVTIGYPDIDARITRPEAAAAFGLTDGRTRFQVRRFGPSQLLEVAVPEPNYHPDRDFEHDASTLGGSSGSPVFRMTDGKFVGLHHDGYPHVANVATEAPLLKDLVRQAKENVSKVSATDAPRTILSAN